MKAVYIEKHGTLDEIKFGNLEPPRCKPDEVLVKTAYCALNHLDIFVTAGWVGLKLEFPHVLGSDGCGEVVELGSEVKNIPINVGDMVTINPGTSCGKCDICLSGNHNFCTKFSIKGEFERGTFAEQFTVPAANVLKIPEGFPLDEAAAAPLSFLTAWRMLTTKAQIKTGDFVFIQGGSGGVSLCALQIANFFGATAIVSTSTEEKAQKLRESGADYVINYNEDPDYPKYVFKEITNRQGCDIVVDSVGAATFPTSLRMLKPGGRLVTCGATSGPIAKINLNMVFWNQLEILGSTMSNQREFREVMNLVFEGKLKPIIGKEFPLSEAKEAEKYLDSGNHFGKIVLKI
ncbi:MAG: zinc-binding dehydrogenase [Candidatus Lokiarchaeota archaeon]|nr:zinc-binding dehydrogenase [Candidatus Lokiarchaeota archaeon]